MTPSLSIALDTAKALLGTVSQFKDVTLKSQINELISQLTHANLERLQTSEKLLESQLRVRELEAQIAATVAESAKLAEAVADIDDDGQMIWKGKGRGKENGPSCFNCYHNRQKMVRITSLFGNSIRQCPECQTPVLR